MKSGDLVTLVAALLCVLAIGGSSIPTPVYPGYQGWAWNPHTHINTNTDPDTGGACDSGDSRTANT